MDTLDMAWTGVRLSAEDRTIFPDGIWNLPWPPALIEIAPHSDIAACRVRVGNQTPYTIAVGAPLVWPFGGLSSGIIPLEIRPHGIYTRGPIGGPSLDKYPVLPRFDSFTGDDKHWPRLALRAYRDMPFAFAIRRADGEYISSTPAFSNVADNEVAIHPVNGRDRFTVFIRNDGPAALNYTIVLRSFMGLASDIGPADRYNDSTLIGPVALAAAASIGYEFTDHGDAVIVYANNGGGGSDVTVRTIAKDR